MTKRILFGLIICSLLIALSITSQRISVELSNQTVEFIADFQDFAELADQDLTMETILEQLSMLGVSKIALSEATVGAQLLEAATASNSTIHNYGDYRATDVLNEPIGFKKEEIDLVLQQQLQPVPKVLAGNFNDVTLSDKLQGLDLEMVIFSGNQVIGYPDQLDETATVLKDKGLSIGLVEFSRQKGMDSIANAGNVVRVHAINKSEMNALSQERIINRYLRTVRERNIRALYLRPFAKDWGLTVGLIEELVQVLTKAGYHLGSARPYKQWQPSIFSVWLCMLGVLAATGFLAQEFFVIPEKLLWLCFAGAGIFGFIGIYSNIVLAQQTFALLAAIVFPTLAIIKNSFSSRSIAKNYLAITSISLAGGLLIIGLLSGTDYLVKLVDFRGVKLMHLFPVIIVFGYGLCANYLPISSWHDFRSGIKKLWGYSVPLKYLAGIFVLMGITGIYILRTGNFGLPVLELEIKLREALERLLLVRPRTKEFLIGHPGLYLLLATRKPHPLLLSVAVIGQLSLVNTFTHIHTPVLLSVLRSFYGLLIGYLIGWVIYQGYRNLKGRLDNDSRFRILRLPK